MALPASTFFTSDDSQDEGTVRQGLDDLLEGVIRLAGSSSEGAPVISSGAITPSYGTIRVDTEAAAATDDLTTINQTNIADKCFLWMRCVDNAREVVVKHTTSGTGHVELNGDLDLTLNRVEQWLILQRQGTKWVEVMRAGREKEHEVGAAGEPAYQNSWTAAPGIYFWKDEQGVVHIRGATSKTSVAVATSVIFALPAGYRPLADAAFPMFCEVGGVMDSTSWLLLTASTGAITFRRTAAPSTVTVGLRLETVSFRAEA